MACEPHTQKTSAQIAQQFNIWLHKNIPSIGDTVYRQAVMNRMPYAMTTPALRRTVIIRAKGLPYLGRVMRQPPMRFVFEESRMFLAPSASTSVAIQERIDPKELELELRILATWLRAREAGLSMSARGSLPDGMVDGELRLHGAHNYGMEVYIPGGERDQVEFADIKRDLETCCYPVRSSGAAGTHSR